MTDPRRHVKDYAGFEQIWVAMLREWDDDLNVACKPGPEKTISLSAPKMPRGTEDSAG